METTMLRKLALGLAAAGSLGIAAFAPSSASAYDGGSHYHRGHHGFGMHRHWHGSHAHFRHHGCIQQRLVRTPWGFRYRPVNVCRF
jgi:Spy/CpxP family protein refolding chaperone